jgi:hypothetical protein
METKNKTQKTLEDLTVNVKLKLSAAWAAMMLIFIYVDHFALYEPGVIEKAIDGKMGYLPTTQAALFAAMALMMIPSLMIFLSTILKPKANRWTNIIVGILYIVVVVGNTVGEAWAFYIFGSVVEVGLLAFIVWSAIKWPKEVV